MKKNIIRNTLIATIAIVAGFNVYQSNVNNEEMSDTVLANIEALAGDELGANGCYVTICNKKCKNYIFESNDPCLCNLCTGKN